VARGAPPGLSVVRCRVSLLALTLAASAASGFATEAGDAEARVRAETGDLVRREVGTRSVRYSYLTRLSVVGGVVLYREPRDFECATACAVKGLIAQAEVGSGGGALSAGWASLVGARGGNRHFLRHVYVGYAVKGALLRTWGSTPLKPTGQTFAGVEAEFTISVACFSFGAYRRVSSAPGEPSWRINGGVGWGF